MNFKTVKCISIMALCQFSGAAMSGTLFVDQAATGLNDGTSWTNAYTSLQTALSAVAFGDEVWVAEGQFFPSRQADITEPNNTTADARDATFWIPRGVKLFGGFGGTESAVNDRTFPLNHTILNGDLGTLSDSTDNAYRVVFYRSKHAGGFGSSDTDQTTRAKIDGFRIINGNANAGSIGGGGMLVRSAVIGTAVYTPQIDIENSKFEKNKTDHWGGGLFASMFGGDIISCDFTRNTATGRGGGASIVAINPGQMFVKDCSFTNNSAGGNGGGLHRTGAPLSAIVDTPMHVINSVFSGNSAGHNGGGFFYFDNGNSVSRLELTNSVFYENEATVDGGGLYINGSTSGPGTIASDGKIYSSTFADNFAMGRGGGVGMGVGATAVVNNSILWNNSASTDAQAHSSSIITYSCVKGGFVGAGNISADPQFFDSIGDDYSLRNDSPALDAGFDFVLPTDVADLDNDSIFAEFLPLDITGIDREIDAGVTDTGLGGIPITDMGAYERCSADMDRNGILDGADPSLFLALYAVADPDADLNGDGSLNAYDLSVFSTSFSSGCGF